LRRLVASLLVTTHQAGKLLLIRDEGHQFNAHFRGFQNPMSMARDGDRLAIGAWIQGLGIRQRPGRGRQIVAPAVCG
jgi:hypothetical protein